MNIPRYRILTGLISSATVASLLIADAAISLPPVEQGNTIQLNGQPWTGRWIRRNDRDKQSIFLQDDWLSGAIGLDMLDSNRAGQQKVKWFSSPLFTEATFDRPIQHRYLDVRPVARFWRTEVEGSTLKIFTPDSTLQALRRSKQANGDRIVFELSAPTPWQIQQQGTTINLILAADLAPSIPTGVNTDKGNSIEALEVQNRGKQTVIRIQSTEVMEPEVETLGDPARIILTLKPDYVPPDVDILWVPGLRRKQQIVSLPNPLAKSDKDPKSFRFSVISLVVDLKQQGLTMRPIWSNPAGMLGTSSLRAMAEQWKAIAAINGGFFNRDRQLPVGPIKFNNRWMAGPVLTRGAIAWNNKGEVFIDRLVFNEEIVTAEKKPIRLSNLNSGYVQKGMARYTPAWGTNYIPLTDNEVLITVQEEKVVSQFKGEKAGQGQIPIPNNGYLLVARQVPELVAQLKPNVQIRGRTSFKPVDFGKYPNILGAGPLLLKNGTVVLDTKLEQFRPPFDKQGASRSAIATTKESGKVILATIHATPEGILPSLPQTAEILKKMGAVNALNLDGGGSTTLFLGGSILNRSLGNIGPVHNGLGVFVREPEKPNNSNQF
ncbi:phosphodiester glycosidase family protein [Pseudanabaena sp. PCC 6802]|uniref:phosphodiester glycosidase family protein n=1 Tax=Pseudanabaena sp. PCC 6802 TaxID=118173 RepID=UPI00036A9AB6|nr:phosphodiester glycosidase family protein [Pseudanabaena sp. PCC 6802]